MSILVLDIEAVVDGDLWTPPEDDPEQFAPAYAWVPVCIGCVLFEEVRGGPVVAKRIGVIDGGGELAVLSRFADTIEKCGWPTIVTWNGRAYDLPVLMLRSMRHGIPHAWYYQSKSTRYRFTEEGHTDLCDAMADYGAARRLHLDGMARLIGLPGKPAGAEAVTGKNMAAAWAAGRFTEIANYCMADAVQTAFLWLRWQLLTGRQGLDWYQAAAGNLLGLCERDPRLAGLVAGIDRPVLLLERAVIEAAPANDTAAEPTA